MTPREFLEKLHGAQLEEPEPATPEDMEKLHRRFDELKSSPTWHKSVREACQDGQEDI